MRLPPTPTLTYLLFDELDARHRRLAEALRTSSRSSSASNHPPAPVSSTTDKATSKTYKMQHIYAVTMSMVSLARACLAVLLLLCPWQRAGAAEFVVGDPAPFRYGWDSGVNYAAWARSRAFAVGDVLVFELYEVVERVYRSCETAGGVVARYTSGYDRVVLEEARTYWFICDFHDLCPEGMKLAVNVSAAGSQSPNYGSNNAASPAGGGAHRSWLAWGLLPLGAVVLM